MSPQQKSSKNVDAAKKSLDTRSAPSPASSSGRNARDEGKTAGKTRNSKDKKVQYKRLNRPGNHKGKASQAPMNNGEASYTADRLTPMARWLGQDMGEEPFHTLSMVEEPDEQGLAADFALIGAASTPGYMDPDLMDNESSQPPYGGNNQGGA